MTFRGVLRWWPVPALIALLIYPWAFREPYYHVLGFYVLLHAAMASSWNIMGGYSGYISLGHSTFYGLGAYLVALAARYWGWNPLWSSPLLALIVALIALILGWITLRTSGAAFVIATLAMVLIFMTLGLNLREITGGAPGLSQPLPPWSPEFSRMPFFYYMLGVLIFTLAVSAYVRRSRFGLGLLAIKDDEGKAAMVGVDTNLYKILAFGLSAYFVALGGGIWSYFTTHISPIFAFDILVGVDMILMTILGGQGTLWGPVLGAAILIPAKDFLLFRFGSSGIYLAIYGFLMLLVVIFLPHGIIPTASSWLARRHAPREAHAGARTMAEMQELHPGLSDGNEPRAAKIGSRGEREP